VNDINDRHKETKNILDEVILAQKENKTCINEIITIHDKYKTIVNEFKNDKDELKLNVDEIYKSNIEIKAGTENLKENLRSSFEGLFNKKSNTIQKQTNESIELYSKKVISDSKTKVDNLYNQVDSLFSVYGVLDNIRYPMPLMRGWGISPDFANVLISKILQNKPENILDLGSGVSSIIMGYCQEKFGKGKVVAIDHEVLYAETTKLNIINHKLQKTVEVIHAPLKEYIISGKKWLWYDLDKINLTNYIDFLVIDGPPGGLQALSRYPAIPLLFDYLSSKATIILDDGNREDETEIVQMWENEFEDLSYVRCESEKGAYIIKFKP